MARARAPLRDVSSLSSLAWSEPLPLIQSPGETIACPGVRAVVDDDLREDDEDVKDLERACIKRYIKLIRYFLKLLSIYFT